MVSAFGPEDADINRENAPAADAVETVAGTVKRVVFHNPDNGFSVLSVDARGFREPVTVVGSLDQVNGGESIKATGKWTSHARFGRQFTADLIAATVPTTEQGLRTYLSYAIDGIGEVYADKLIEAFGGELLDIIESEPNRLREVDGIGAQRANKIKQAWDRKRADRDATMYFLGHGIGMALTTRILRTYGPHAVQAVAENPYRLASEVWGVGFQTADRLALRVGIAADDIRRARAGVVHLTNRAADDDGDCGVRVDDLAAQAAELLSIDERQARQAVDAEFARKGLIAAELQGEIYASLPELYHAEQGIAQRIDRLKQGNPPWQPVDTDSAIEWVQNNSNIRFGPSQAEAVRLAVLSKFTVITGGPGVGKTTIVNAILRILEHVKEKTKLCAPTGRAAKRMTEATGRHASTIHRLLAFEPESGGFRHGKTNPLTCDLLVVDETSMIDVKLMNSLLQAVPDHAAVIVVGDVDQLPSIGPGRVLGDIIDSAAVPVVKLTEVYRQAKTSQIVRNAHMINAGRTPDLARKPDSSDFYFIAAETPERAQNIILKLVCDRIPDRFGFDPIRDTQVLCPLKRGSVGVQSLNVELQAALNPDPDDSIERFGMVFARGDKVMQTRNDYEKYVFNGDIGFVSGINQPAKKIEIDFDGRAVEYEFDKMDGLTPAYAVTIHKSQGSEFPAVVLPIMTQHYIMLRRKLLYTGVTRGKRLVVLVGQKSAIGIAVRGGEAKTRVSRLGSLLA